MSEDAEDQDFEYVDFEGGAGLAFRSCCDDQGRVSVG